MKNLSNPSFLFFRIISYNFFVYAYFTYASGSSTLINDVTKLVMYRILNTDCVAHILSENLTLWLVLIRFLLIKTSNVFSKLWFLKYYGFTG